MATPTFHFSVFPWFAMGHITPYLHLSNKLAERGHRVSFLMPTRTRNKFNHLNHHPTFIQFIPLTIPQVGLPDGVELMSEVPSDKLFLLGLAFDLTKDQVSIALQDLKPDCIFFDFASWVPSLAHSLGIKSIYFSTASAASCAFVYVSSKEHDNGQHFSAELDLIKPPPTSCMKQLPYETRNDTFFYMRDLPLLNGRSLFDRLVTSMSESEAVLFRGCSETEAPFCDYLKKLYNKEVLLVGPILPEPSSSPLEERWIKWLSGFKKGSIVYCSFGSECVLEKNQFQELVLGLELTGLPFFVRLKTPIGAEVLEEALPEGFEERVKGRGLVHGGWVQQQLFLNHPSVGCFISHCGFGSLWESLVSPCEIVLLPHFGDQFENTKFMTKELKVAVEVERRGEDGWFTRESVCKALKLVMDEGSEIGGEIKANHQKWKDFLLTKGLESSYVDNLIIKLQEILR